MSQRARKARRRSRGGFARKIVVAAGALALTLGVGVAVLGAWVLSVASSAPSIDELKPVDAGTNSQIFAADGSRLGFIQSDHSRTPVPLRRIPETLQEATIAIEDERFYQHSGVDYRAIVRAAVENLEAGGIREGGSTLSQQLVKNLYIADPEDTLDRKIREAKLASDLEQRHDKDWILEQYLNTASYGTNNGRTAVGVEAAARTYFSKPVRKINLAQAALLAGLPQAPSQYNPFQNPNRALERRNEVLESMHRLGHISDSEHQQASSSDLQLERGYRYEEIREPYFFDYVEQELIERYGVNTVRQGGLKVHTTIDPELQEAGRVAIENHLGGIDDPSSAAVTIDPDNGQILAMASSAKYDDNQFNLAAQGLRQPGSAFKTMALLAAVDMGIDPSSTSYVSKQLNLNDPQWGQWEVSTYDNSYRGSMSLARATLSSDNTVYAQLALDIGPDKVRDAAYAMGIETELDGYPAETLGGLHRGVSPLEMANAYATLASGGIRNTPTAITRVELPDGEVDEPPEGQRERAFSDGVAYEVTKILQQNHTGGTGTGAYSRSGCANVAGKTGTTDDFNDAWYVAYTPHLSTAVWVGYPDALRSMPGMAGGTAPASIWGDYMAVAMRGVCDPFPQPSEPASLSAYSGKYASQGGDSFDDDDDADELDEEDAYAPGAGQRPSPGRGGRGGRGGGSGGGGGGGGGGSGGGSGGGGGGGGGNNSPPPAPEPPPEDGGGGIEP